MGMFKIKCLEAKYEHERQEMYVNCVLSETGERRILVWPREDVENCLRSKMAYKGQFTENDIHWFASELSQKKEPFDIFIGDDPNTKIMTPEEEIEYASKFKKQIGEELTKVCDGLVDETGKMKRKLGDLLESGKVDAIKLLQEEKIIRGKIG